PRPGRTGVGPRAVVGPAGRLRGDHRPRGSATAAAHHARSGAGAQLGAAARRPGKDADHQAVGQAEARGVLAEPMSATHAGARVESRIERVDLGVYTIPTDAHEADATLEWAST